MKDANSSEETSDYRETVCPIQCDALIQENRSALDDYLKFCSTRLVLPILNFNDRQLHLFGSMTANIEAEKRFLELQNQLLVESSRKTKDQRAHWWYEAWDGTWRLYSPTMITEIEQQHKSKQTSFTILNDIGEKITIDLSKLVETYGSRTKRIRRSKLQEQQPSHWALTPLNLERFVLDGKSSEYLSVKASFDETMREYYTDLVCIERIQNIRIFKQFCVLHEDYIERYGQETNGTMRFLYHGCPESVSTRIVERGFNRSYCGVNGCVYGRGVYFSAKANFSDKYATANSMKQKRMFYSRVLVGKSMIGNPKMYEPEDGYDTTTDGTHIFVCYHDGQCYPEYLLTYV